MDTRYKITYGNVHSKDDPMGMALMIESTPIDQSPENHPKAVPAPTGSQPEAGNEYLDAFNKGKGRGKGDGKCHICNGEGHFARGCPSVPLVSPQAWSAWAAMDEAITSDSAQRPTTAEGQRRKGRKRRTMLGSSAGKAGGGKKGGNGKGHPWGKGKS